MPDVPPEAVAAFHAALGNGVFGTRKLDAALEAAASHIAAPLQARVAELETRHADLDALIAAEAVSAERKRIRAGAEAQARTFFKPTGGRILAEQVIAVPLRDLSDLIDPPATDPDGMPAGWAETHEELAEEKGDEMP